MMCERYWRDGIVLVERGLDDPHRDGCEDCRRAHASRQELIDALPLIGADVTGDPYWQAKVWEHIDRPTRAPRRWRWQLAGVLAAASAIALWIGLDRARPRDEHPGLEAGRPRVEIIEADPPRRSGAPHVDDHLQVFAGKDSDVLIYREGRLMQQCRPRQTSDLCVPDRDGMTINMELPLPGEYLVIVTLAPFAAAPSGKLDDDLAALKSAGVAYKSFPQSVF